MPAYWKIGDDPWIRYKNLNITILKEKIRMIRISGLFKKCQEKPQYLQGFSFVKVEKLGDFYTMSMYVQ